MSLAAALLRLDALGLSSRRRFLLLFDDFLLCFDLFDFDLLLWRRSLLPRRLLPSDESLSEPLSSDSAAAAGFASSSRFCRISRMYVQLRVVAETPADPCMSTAPAAGWPP